jgi:Zn-dependent peptidase ImmA (M78 family)
VKWLILALLLWATPAEAQQGRGTKNWRVGVEYLNTLNGVAFCRDEGSFYLVKGGLSAMEKAATEAHEATHIKQHGRFKDCKAFYKYYDTPVGKLETEAEAFAAGLCVQQQMGADPVSLKQWYLSLLIKYYVPGTQIYEASQIFSRYERCP